MPQTGPTELGPEYGDFLATIPQFSRRYPHLYKNPYSVQWQVRDRATNGLNDYGAVVEVYGKGNRPSIFIHIPNWFAWMRAGGSRAPRRPAPGQLARGNRVHGNSTEATMASLRRVR